MRHGKIGTAQGTKVRNSESENFKINAHAQHNEPAHFGYDIREFTEISQISRKISRFQRRFHGFHERFQDFNGDFMDFTDFTKDFKISTEISRISRKISGSQRRFPDLGKDFRFHERFQVKCTRFR